METKKTNTKRMIAVVIACALIFILVITMLVDLILVNLSVAPVFSRIVSTKYEDTNYGTVIEGHGILYSTITAKEEFANGYFAAYNFFPGVKKWDEAMQLDIDFYPVGETEENVLSPEDDDFDDLEDIFFDGYVLNMQAVRELAFAGITPFEFMERYHGTLSGTDPVTYFVALPNEYIVQIEYSGNNINSIQLEDHQLGIFIDLLKQSLDIDSFLLERNQ